MFLFSIFLTTFLDFTKTIIPLAPMAKESIAHSAFGVCSIVYFALHLWIWSDKKWENHHYELKFYGTHPNFGE